MAGPLRILTHAFSKCGLLYLSRFVALSVLSGRVCAQVASGTDGPCVPGIAFDVAQANSLNGRQVVVNFSTPLDRFQTISTNLLTLISPVGHTVSNIAADPDKGRLTFDINPPLLLAYASLRVSDIKLTSGEMVSGLMLVQSRDLKARNLDNETPWNVIPLAYEDFEFTPIGKGFAGDTDDAGYLSSVNTLDPNGGLVVESASDLKAMSAGIMLRKAGVSKQPFLCLLLRIMDTNAVQCVAIERGTDGGLSWRALADLPVSATAGDPSYRINVLTLSGSRKVSVGISGGGLFKSIQDINLLEGQMYDECGLISYRVGETEAVPVRVRFRRLIVETSVPLMSWKRLGGNGVRLSSNNPSFIPVHIEQLQPCPSVRVLKEVVIDSQQIYVDVIATNDASFYTVRRLRY